MGILGRWAAFGRGGWPPYSDGSAAAPGGKFWPGDRLVVNVVANGMAASGLAGGDAWRELAWQIEWLEWEKFWTRKAAGADPRKLKLPAGYPTLAAAARMSDGWPTLQPKRHPDSNLMTNGPILLKA